MKFGKLDDVSQVDFTLPDDPPENREVLRGGQGLRLFVGAPQWATKQWVGKSYPAGTKDRDMLRLYARRYNTIELNTTFYRIPSEETVLKWKEAVSGDFRFCPKLAQSITHFARFGGNALQATELFCDRLALLEEHLGCFFIQLPPNFTVRHQGTLLAYLEHFPMPDRLAIEFRHQSWFADQARAFHQICDQLARWGISTVITDVAGRRDVLHTRLTSRCAMIRFVGNDLHPTDFARADAWVGRIAQWAAQGLELLYFFPHQPDNLLTPEMTSYLCKQFQTHLGIALPDPKPPQIRGQVKLF